MSEPSNKAPEIEDFLETVVSHFGHKLGRKQSIRENICVTCGGEAVYFKDDLSAKEYTLSGMCQKCQDDFFEPKEDDDE